ncbi:MAG: efflux RND transporter periplasmic adaptor subunit [Thermoguttaceae bacterium]|nr:efflux RND transporter periplasmic adaptor subunit [Thermoguttaceae bacterium]
MSAHNVATRLRVWNEMLCGCVLLGCVLLAGCAPQGEATEKAAAADGKAAEGKAAATGQAAPVPVKVTSPIQREIVDAEEFRNARVEAINQVEVRSRVSGYLTKIYFQPGAEVKKGDPLFEIDPRTYQASYDQALAQLQSAEAQVQIYDARVARLKSELDRGEILLGSKAMTQEDLDKQRADYAEAIAGLAAAKAGISAAKATADNAKLDLDFTQITSPVDGIVDRELATLGNLVTIGATQLTQVVSIDPIYVYFDIDVGTVLKLQKLARNGEVKPFQMQEGAKVKVSAENPDARFLNEQKWESTPVYIGLADDAGYPTKGYLEYGSPCLRKSTGLLTLRAVVPNPKVNGIRRYMPGIYANVRLPVSQPYTAMMIPEKAIGTDQNISYVIVVNDQNLAEYRFVKLGKLQSDNMRVVLPWTEEEKNARQLKDLTTTDRIVTEGLLLARPGSPVIPVEDKSIPKTSAVTDPIIDAEGATDTSCMPISDYGVPMFLRSLTSRQMSMPTVNAAALMPQTETAHLAAKDDVNESTVTVRAISYQ